jgi:hypothetical protein
MSDEAILMEAVAQNYMCLEFAAAPLRADREFMLHAVREEKKKKYRGGWGSSRGNEKLRGLG